MTSTAVAEREVMLCIGDTTYLDYGSIKVKREGYGPTGNGGNGLIRNSAKAQLMQNLDNQWDYYGRNCGIET